MRIALFHNLPSGGAKRHTSEQLRELAARGYSVVEFTTSQSDNQFCSFKPYVNEQCFYDFSPSPLAIRKAPLITPYIHLFQGITNLERMNKLNRVIAENINGRSFDLVFVKDCQLMPSPYILRYITGANIFQCHHINRPYEPSAIGFLKGKSTIDKIKQIYYAPASSLFRNHFIKAETRNIQSASLVLTNSLFSKRVLYKNFRINSNVLYPGINNLIFRNIPLYKEENYVLSVGALTLRKGYRFLVSAISKINSVIRPQLWIVANSIDQQEKTALVDLANRLQVKLKIEKVTDDTRLVEIYNCAKVFVYAPLQEPLGMAPLEAMACGTPVLAVEEGGVKETVLDGITGYLVGRDPVAFAEKLETLLTRPGIRNAMGEAGIDYIHKEWSWERAVDKLEDQFRKVLNRS
jgi:glycosyltransferase involved in cell wall biosynthesis